MSELDLKVIRARANAASPGARHVRFDDEENDKNECCQIEADYKDWWDLVAVLDESATNHSANAQFIAHARQDVPALLDRVEELEKEIAFLRSKPRKRQGISSAQRFRIFSRDRFTCRYCGARGGPDVPLEIDHHTPVSKGGGNDDENLWTACFGC